jgi:hypothetical protein
MLRIRSGLVQIQLIEDAVYCDIQRKIRGKGKRQPMLEFTGPGVVANYTIAVILFLSCALLFICAKKADEINCDRSSEELTTALDERANTDTIDYENYAAQYIRAAQHTDAQEQRALLLMIARAWTQMAEQAQRIRWAMSMLEVGKQS